MNLLPLLLEHVDLLLLEKEGSWGRSRRHGKGRGWGVAIGSRKASCCGVFERAAFVLPEQGGPLLIVRILLRLLYPYASRHPCSSQKRTVRSGTNHSRGGRPPNISITDLDFASIRSSAVADSSLTFDQRVRGVECSRKGVAEGDGGGTRLKLHLLPRVKGCREFEFFVGKRGGNEEGRGGRREGEAGEGGRRF